MSILKQVRKLSPNEEVYERVTSELTERAIALIEYQSQGFDSSGLCIRCMEEVEGVEPDACGYRCEECDTWTVYGAEEVLLSVAPLT